MRRILLTPSQVSFLISAFIIISCTFALFLSGYVLQQRTLRDLRTAIRPRQPRQKPQSYLPDHFKPIAEVLEDGTVVHGESAAEREQREILIEVSPSVAGSQQQQPALRREGAAAAPSEKVAMVERLKAQMEEKSWAVEHPDPLVKSKVPVTRAERRRLIKEELARLSQSEERVYYQRRLW